MERVTYCLACGGAASTHVEFCPKCGAPLWKEGERRKPRLFWILLAAAVVTVTIATWLL